MEMEREFVVANKNGLHCRAAVTLADAVKGYDARIIIRSGDSVANADSILDIMALGLQPGDNRAGRCQRPAGRRGDGRGCQGVCR